MQLRVALCDDHMTFCTYIEGFVREFCEARSIPCDCDVFYSGETLCHSLKRGAVYDIIFLDIELGVLSGLDVAKYVRDNMNDDSTQIAFVSGKEEYALSLFQIHPIDFLVKPILPESVYRVLYTLQRMLALRQSWFEYPMGRDRFRVPLDEILYFSVTGHKMIVTTTNGLIEYYGTMQQLNEQLQSPVFLQVHKSFVINANYVRFAGYEYMEMTDGAKIPIGPTRRKEIRATYLNLHI